MKHGCFINLVTFPKSPDFAQSSEQSFSSSHRLLFHHELFRSHYVFVLNVLITGYLHISFCSTGCGNLFFQTEHQITFTNTHHISVHCPTGLRLGAAVSYAIYVGTGNSSSMAWECCSPCKTGRTHCSPMDT